MRKPIQTCTAVKEWSNNESNWGENSKLDVEISSQEEEKLKKVGEIFNGGLIQISQGI